MNDMVEADGPRSHLWKKGQSGNPSGRPKGAKNAITLAKLQLESELRGQIGPKMALVMDKCVELALNGDTQMIRLLADSWLSKARSNDNDDAPREKVQIIIGKLDQQPEIEGRVIKGE